MPILHAIVLGITQGLSEFLPISSSGHLRLVPWLFGWDDFAGQASLEKTFDVALHLGTLIGALAYFRTDVVRYARAGLRRDARHTTDGRLAWLIALSTIPAALTGALFADVIEEKTGYIWLIATMLIVFGLVLGWADRRPGARTLDEVRPRDALLMGVGQALALQPGVSRSGVTMTAGRLGGLGRDGAARFAFLMSLPITAGALLFKGVDVASEGIPDGFVAPFVWGIVASGITGWFAVWGTLRLIRTRTFTPFVLYRLVAGVAVLALYTLR
ncbi:MAG TPA: undecaprenyl-diphosphate phosphatase [Acidimicrobiales bacterium]|nr:undecaprenyl-diphosphate phosphatase [Acidimicrobiales bacterium]